MLIPSRLPLNNEDYAQMIQDAKTLPQGVRMIDCKYHPEQGWLITNLATGQTLTRKEYERKYKKKLNLPIKPPEM